VSTRNTIPVLSGIYLEAVGQELLLKATDLELAIHKRIPADVLQEGAVVLPGRYLLELVRRLPPQELEVSLDPRNSTTTISSADGEYTMHGFPADQFPADSNEPGLPGLMASSRALRTLLREVAFATGHDESRPYITGVAFSVKGETATATAADGAVLATGRVQVENPGDMAFAVILPGRSIQELGRLLSEHDHAPCEICPSGSQFTFRLGNLHLVTRLLSGVFPDWLRLLPTEYPTVVRVARERLLQACERAALLAPKGTVGLEARPDGLHILASTPEVGRLAERVPAECSGPGFTVPLNADYLLAGLRAGGSVDIWLEIANPRSAVRFRSVQSPDSFFVVLPLLRF